jgi:hypothetical protein
VYDRSRSWPIELRGADLGALETSLRRELILVVSKRKPPLTIEENLCVQKLTTLGYCLDNEGRRFQSFLKSLEVYQGLHGHLCVPVKFRIAKEDDRWPQSMRGQDLGGLVSRVRMGLQFSAPQQVEALDRVGYVWDVKTSAFNLIIVALLAHYELFGDYLVPRYFVVPQDDPDWPRATWGLSLGNRVRNIRSYSCYNEPTYRKKLDNIGFEF